MPEQKSRFTMTIPDSILTRAEEIKKNVYYNKTYSEMYRQLIELGMNSLEQNKTTKLQCAGTETEPSKQ